MTTQVAAPLKVLYHLHPKFDILDFTGVLEILSHATYYSNPTKGAAFAPTITAGTEYVTSGQKCTVRRNISPETAHATLADYDVLVIPGGGTKGVELGVGEPAGLVRAFSALRGRPRTILSVCTGSLFLAGAGVLKGLTATTHPFYDGQLRDLTKGETTVVKERYVVNPIDETGLRVITSGGVSCGMDAALWLVSEVAGKESAVEAAEVVQYARREGIVV